MEESVVIKRKRKWIEENKKRKYDGCDEDGRKETERDSRAGRKPFIQWVWQLDAGGKNDLLLICNCHCVNREISTSPRPVQSNLF